MTGLFETIQKSLLWPARGLLNVGKPLGATDPGARQRTTSVQFFW